MERMESHRTVVQTSNDADIWIQHGDEMMYKGNMAKALELYDKALEYKPDSANALYNKANALETLGKYEEAVICYDSALKCDPQDADCWFNKGLTLKKLGREDEGMICINKGVHIAMGR